MFTNKEYILVLEKIEQKEKELNKKETEL